MIWCWLIDGNMLIFIFNEFIYRTVYALRNRWNDVPVHVAKDFQLVSTQNLKLVVIAFLFVGDHRGQINDFFPLLFYGESIVGKIIA